jgi:cell division protein FtsL
MFFVSVAVITMMLLWVSYVARRYGYEKEIQDMKDYFDNEEQE